MKIYYKGDISSELSVREVLIGIIFFNYGSYSFDYSIDASKLNNSERYELGDYIKMCMNTKRAKFKKMTGEKMNDKLDVILSELRPIFDSSSEEIIYEKFEDIHGNLYGKELLTGLIFPIYQSKNNKQSYELYNGTTSGHIYTGTTADGIKGTAVYARIYSNYQVNTMAKCTCIIDELEVADNNEINDYKNKTSKEAIKEFTEEIRYLYNKNVFSEMIIPKKEAPKPIQNQETKIMENIEYQLKKISKINRELHKKYFLKYQKIISCENQPNTINKIETIDIEELNELQLELEFYLNFYSQEINDIFTLLEKTKFEYLENILSNKKTKSSMSLEDIDLFEEIFLKNKDEYSLVQQRTILKDIAFIYFMEVYLNIDSIQINELENSYFSNNLKTILIIIDSLKELGIINNVLEIDLNKEINLKYVIDIIKKIRFNTIEKESAKKLIKTI